MRPKNGSELGAQNRKKPLGMQLRQILTAALSSEEKINFSNYIKAQDELAVFEFKILLELS